MNTLNALVPLVAKDPVPEASKVGPGAILFLVFVLLVVVTILLWRSMRKQISRIDFDEDNPGVPAQAPDSDPAHQD